MDRRLSPAMIALVAVLIAFTTLLTAAVQIPMPAAGGYLNFSDVAVAFAGLVFGPWVGLAAGGIGTALADLSIGYAMWAPISLVAHGAEGFLVGLLARRISALIRSRAGRQEVAAPEAAQGGGLTSVRGMIAAYVVGATVMVLIYLAGQTLFISRLLGDTLLEGWRAAMIALPLNVIQAVVGGVVGIPLVIAVRRAYPPIDRIGQRGHWTEG